MMSMLYWELRQRRMYIFWWCVVIVGLLALLFFIYPSIRDQAQQLDAVFKQLPANFRSLKGFNGDIGEPEVYLNGQVYYVTLPLLFSIMTIGLGSSLLARDEQARTLELLLARPVGRLRVIAAKALAGVAIVAIVSIVATLAAIVFAKLVDMHIGVQYLLLANLFSAIFTLSFGAIAFAMTAFSSATRRASIGASVFVAFGGYILTSLASSSDWIKTPAKFFPYHYYTPQDILNGNISTGLCLYIAGILAVATVATVVGFRRRDIS